MKINKNFIADKIYTGLKHYLTDQTSWGLHEDGLQDTRIDIELIGNELVIVTKDDVQPERRFLIEVAEEI